MSTEFAIYCNDILVMKLVTIHACYDVLKKISNSPQVSSERRCRVSVGDETIE